jgi:hypothetical protein
MRAWVTVLLVMLPGLVVPVAAQDQPASAVTATLTPGARVRLRTGTYSIPARGIEVKDPGRGSRLVGIVTSVDAGMLTLQAGDLGATLIPTASISEIDVSVGQKRRWRLGLAVGVGLGVLAGFAVPVDASNCGPQSESLCSRGQGIGAGMLLLGGAGVVIGALTMSDHWERKYNGTPRREGLTVAPLLGPARIGAVATLRF